MTASNGGGTRDPFRRNNFDLLRLLFASTVFLVHSQVLSESTALAPLSAWLSSEVAIRAFFVVSGLLVCMSFENASSLASYAEKRVRRIYPAYAAVVLIAAFGLSLVSLSSAAEYFSVDLLRYAFWNLLFLNFVHPTVPGVFVSNPFHEVNGALWTLKIEVMFYAFVPILVWLVRRCGALAVIATLYVLSLAYWEAMGWLAADTGRSLFVALQRQLPGQLVYFLAGALVYYRFDWFRRNGHWLAGAAVVVLGLERLLPLGALEPLALGIVVCYFGFFWYVGNFGRYGDLSYGVYIYHFPVVQLLVAAGLFAASPLLALAAATAIVFGAAFASWHLVEKPCLRRTSHYVRAEGRKD